MPRGLHTGAAATAPPGELAGGSWRRGGQEAVPAAINTCRLSHAEVSVHAPRHGKDDGATQ